MPDLTMDFRSVSRRLVWDEVGERFFQAGVDRGVLYLQDGNAVAWNGLTSVEIGSLKDTQSYFLDGVKYLEHQTPGDFSGKLQAITYPSEFDSVIGIKEVGPGLFYHDQLTQSFNLCYRTKLGNDLDGVDHGYKIHILYNLIADADPVSFETMSDTVQPSEFSWSLSGVPPTIRRGYRPTVHISLDSTQMGPNQIKLLENILYGSDTSEPRLPGIDEITDLISSLGLLLIIDNGDGTWTAVDETNDFITMLDDTTFQIDNADAVYLDATTYEISTTEPD